MIAPSSVHPAAEDVETVDHDKVPDPLVWRN